MTLYVGRHMIGMNQKRDADYKLIDPPEWEPAPQKSEMSVEYEIISLGPILLTSEGVEELTVQLKKVY